MRLAYQVHISYFFAVISILENQKIIHYSQKNLEEKISAEKLRRKKIRTTFAIFGGKIWPGKYFGANKLGGHNLGEHFYFFFSDQNFWFGLNVIHLKIPLDQIVRKSWGGGFIVNHNSRRKNLRQKMFRKTFDDFRWNKFRHAICPKMFRLKFWSIFTAPNLSFLSDIYR